MIQFRVGDIVVANEKANYFYTVTTKATNFKGKVLRTLDEDRISVECIDSVFPGAVGMKFKLRNDCCDLYDDIGQAFLKLKELRKTIKDKMKEKGVM